ARSMADTGPIEGRYMPHAPRFRPIRKAPAQPNATPPASDGARPNQFTTRVCRSIPHLLELVARIVGVAAPIVVRVRGGLVRALGDGFREIFVRQFMQNFGRAKSLIPLAGRDESRAGHRISIPNASLAFPMAWRRPSTSGFRGRPPRQK